MPEGKHLYEFGPFRLDPAERSLLRDGQAVPLTPKAFELLVLLVENRGHLLKKDELIDRVWPNTFVEEANLAQNISALRKALDDKNGGARYIETVPKGGYRFTDAVVDHSRATGVESHAVESLSSRLASRPPLRRVLAFLATAAVVVTLTLAFQKGSLHLRSSGAATVVLADFANATGESVFDDTLRQALAVQLEQSPFLSLVSDQRVQETLQQMEKAPDTRVTSNIARELCQRTESTAIIEGSIAKLGDNYVVGLTAIHCHTGEVLAREQVTSDDKSHVLAVLGKAARGIRGKLGESHTSLANFDTPLEQATTSSLEALKAYSLGAKKNQLGEITASLPFFQRAIQLDPNFAMAYAALGWNYGGLGEASLAVENFKKAFDLRGPLNEQEKLSIESAYYGTGALGDLERARQTDELWEQTYPRDAWPPSDLSFIYSQMGEFDKSLVEAKEALRRDSTFPPRYAMLANSYINLDRLKDARATAEEAQAKSSDSPNLHFCLYQISFLQDDAAGMAQQLTWSAGNPDAEDQLLFSQAFTAAYFGRLMEARKSFRGAIASAERNKKEEAAAGYKAWAAAVEAMFGNAIEARQQAGEALALAKGHDVQKQIGAAMALALAGDAVQAQTLADDLARRFPQCTLMQFIFLPTIYAQIALNRTDSAKAIEVLRTAASYELAGNLLPVYVRGKAYLTARQAREAVVEFQKILDHRGIVQNQPIGALGYLGLARAYGLQGDIPKARAAYQEFFALWKDADADIPILNQAKAEYAKLQ